MLQTQKKDLVENEMNELTKEYQNDKLEFIKNPVIAEFLGMASNTDFTESDLENSILSNLQKFLMELGKGYAFVARQQHIHTEKQDYYINLVFYNYILKCFVLIDLKTQKITHQDVGQMDMYIRMYDELKRSEGDNPTIGIVLCSDTDEDAPSAIETKTINAETPIIIPSMVRKVRSLLAHTAAQDILQVCHIMLSPHPHVRHGSVSFSQPPGPPHYRE